MNLIGMIGILMAFTGALIGIVALVLGYAFREKPIGETLSWAGRIGAIIATAALTLSCGILVYSFLVGNVGIQYVLENRVTSTGAMGVLYRISGLWAGREGSLLFWAWLISIFGCMVSIRRLDKLESLDNIAVLIIELVLLAFVGILLFSQDNIPFLATEDIYLNSDGTLNAAGQLQGMNSLLQHWAMAIHPPMLFLGYAGLTVPFAYAISTAVLNRTDTEWIDRSERYALAAWMFLTLGIGLGAIWAYAVLGWGGYWGWDPVENASLLPWLVALALIHSFTVYKNRGMFKGWAIMCASLAFAFCIVGTFISRSGLVQSVHAFEGDSVSLVLFGSLIVISLLMGVFACVVRRKSSKDDSSAPAAESMLSKDGAYFINNVLMVLLAFLFCYLTIAQALPSWLPFGGSSISSGTYEVLARPIGILYLLMMAVCPLLGWVKTDPRAFARKARVPAVCALVLFALLAAYWALVFVPTYNEVVAAGDSNSQIVLEQGPAIYYNGLALFGLLVASLLVFNSLFQLVRVIKARKASTGKGILVRLSGSLSHLATGIVLVGLVGSAMYVTEVSGYMPYNESNDSYEQRFVIKDYELEFVDADASMAANKQDANYTIRLNVYKGGNYLGTVSPMITLVGATQQQKYTAGVIGLPQEDLFVVYQGANENNDIHLDVKVNPFISFVWAGIVLMVMGMLASLLGPRGSRPSTRRALVGHDDSGDTEHDDSDDSKSALSAEAREKDAVDQTSKRNG